MKRNFYALALLVCSALGASAQTVWDLSTTGLPNRNICSYIHAPTAMLCAATVRDSANTAANPVNVYKIVTTADGGGTWNIKNITNAAGLSSASIWMKDANTIFVPMYNGTAGGGKLMRTTDGGNTWAAVAPTAFPAPDGFPNIVAFTSATTGITMGDPVGGYFEIQRTTDGGATWTRIPQASIAPIVAGEYGLTDVFGVNGNSIWFGTNKGRVYRSSDAGLTWAASSTHYQAAAKYVSGIAMQDATTGFAYSSGNGTAVNALDDLAKTTDGGATWTNITNTGIGFAGRGDIKWMQGTPNTYFVSGTSQCKYSYNGGMTWVATTETNGNTSFGTMTFPTPTKGFAASNYFTGPVAIWDGPASAPACITLMGANANGHPEMCSGDSITFWVRADNAGDPTNAVSLRFQTQGDNGVWGAAQTVSMTTIGVTPDFVADGGVGTVGTLSIGLSLRNSFSATFNEISRWRAQIVPSACPNDTTAATYTNVYLDVAGDPVGPPIVPGCATTVINGNTISVSTAACNKPTPRVAYNVVAYIVNGGAATPGSSYTATVPGTYDVDFGIDNGICIQVVSGQLMYTGTENGTSENGITLYPNPATDKVNLNVVNKAASANIYDVNGRLVSSQSVIVEGNVTTIPTNTLAPGIYFLQTLDAQGAALARFRFVKQ
jgi:photosystem II stability/assembly factor-like uncharacterized protein